MGRSAAPSWPTLPLAPAEFPELNAIVHPAVIAAEDEWMRLVLAENPRGVAIVEAALILEAHAEDRFDKLITVTCTLDQKVERFAARHNMAASRCPRRS